MKKFLVVSYGLMAYVLFLGSFLYAIGFVGNFAVPKTINSGPEGDFMPALLINIGVLSVFALQHSIMARPAFKRWWTRIIPSAIERSTYVLLSSLALILIFWQWQAMPLVVWQVEQQSLIFLIYGIFALGWLIVLLSTFMINHFDLFGLKQVYEYAKSIEPRPVEFKLHFFYRLVRHPIMLGFIIAFWAIPVMTLGHLVFALTTTAYIMVAITYLEERDLLRMHGESYREYQRSVPKIIPFSKRKRRPEKAPEIV